MKIETRVWTLDELILADKVKLGRGDVISKKDIANFPGEFPIYSSAREKNGTFGYYGKYMFDEELITWSIDGGGRLFYRPRHKFSVTNVGGTLRIIDTDFLDCRYLHLVLTHLHSKIRFDWVYKAHPSVIRTVYNEIPIPSLEKQREIVEKLDSAFAEIDLLERNLGVGEEKSNQLLHSLLSSAFSSDEDENGTNNPSNNLLTVRKLVSLGTVAEVIAGQSPEGIYYNSNGDGAPFYQGKKEFGDKFLGAPTTWTTKVTKLAQSGDILMSVRAPVGPINFSTQEICIGRGLASIRASKSVDKEFLYYFLLHKQPEISGNTGAVFDSINKDQIASIEIPLPPLEKQREIVEMLDSSFTEVELLKGQIRTKKNYASSLRQSLLSNAFTQEEEVA